MRSRLIVMSIALLVWLVDLASKQWALKNLADGQRVSVIGDILTLRLIANPGAAFSVGTDYTWIFTVLAVVVIASVLVTAARVDSGPWLWGFGGLVGGAAGNLTDRLIQPPRLGMGYVTDFIALPNFPVFNAADIAIVCSVAVMVVASARNIPMSAPTPRHHAGPAHG